MIGGEPDAGEDAQRGDAAADPRRRCAPDQPHRNQSERDGQHEIGDPDRHAQRDDVAGRLIALNEGDPAERKDRRDRGTGEARDEMSGGPDPALREELAGRQGEQLALARRNRGAEHAHPQRQHLREWPGPWQTSLKHLAGDNLRQRQQHDAGHREAREDVLGAYGDLAHLEACAPGVSTASRARHQFLPPDFLNASRSRTARS